jgi:hypothetical protein
VVERASPLERHAYLRERLRPLPPLQEIPCEAGRRRADVRRRHRLSALIFVGISFVAATVA